MREKRFFVPTLVITVDVLDCLFFPSLYLVYKYLFPPLSSLCSIVLVSTIGDSIYLRIEDTLSMRD